MRLTPLMLAVQPLPDVVMAEVFTNPSCSALLLKPVDDGDSVTVAPDICVSSRSASASSGASTRAPSYCV